MIEQPFFCEEHPFDQQNNKHLIWLGAGNVKLNIHHVNGYLIG